MRCGTTIPWFVGEDGNGVTYSNTGTTNVGGFPVVTSGTLNNVQPVVRNDNNTREDKLFAAGWANTLQFDPWTFKLDLSYSKRRARAVGAGTLRRPARRPEHRLRDPGDLALRSLLAAGSCPIRTQCTCGIRRTGATTAAWRIRARKTRSRPLRFDVQPRRRVFGLPAQLRRRRQLQPAHQGKDCDGLLRRPAQRPYADAGRSIAADGTDVAGLPRHGQRADLRSARSCSTATTTSTSARATTTCARTSSSRKT